MNLKEFNKIIQDEETLHSFLGVLLPMICFSILFTIDENETNDNLSEFVWIIPISYLIILFVVYERKFFFKQLKTKSSQYFFDTLTYERAVIRFEYIEKFYKYSIIALIIISLIVSIGIYFTVSQQISHYEEYEVKNNIYQDKIKETYELSEDQLREYFHNQVYQMNTMQVDSRIVSIMGNEVYDSTRNATFAEFHQPGNVVLWNMDSDIDRRNFLHFKYDSMTYEQLEKILFLQMEQLKPNPFDYNSVDNTFIEFLFFVWTIPAFMMYVMFLSKSSLTKHSDFYYLLSKSCFSIVSTLKELDEMKKRKYLLAGLNYYEKFVKRNTSMNINRFNEIKSMFVNYDTYHISRVTQKFLESLEHDNKLQLLEFIQNKINILDPSQFLIYITLSNKIKENWKIIATGITVLLQITLHFATYHISQTNPPTN